MNGHTPTQSSPVSRPSSDARPPPRADGWRTGCVQVGGVKRRKDNALCGRNRRRLVGGSDAGDVGGEEVDAVSVEVAAGAVVVLGGAGVGVPGEDLGVA